ncbi:MAG: hypothetical protein IPH55_19850 [Betaproteobacteria bacterium]|nr:hypothetical protein [Betaproteobacteria bacterium]
MGTLRFFNLQPLLEQFGCRVLFETGTGLGDAVQYASYFRLDRLISVEINAQLAEHARESVGRDPRVRIFCDSSEAVLRSVLPQIPKSTPILFWLDAHFPGADYGLGEYQGEADHDLRLPLQRELATIAELRAGARDVLLLDDLRVYEDGDYEQGPCPAEALPPAGARNLDCLQPWQTTHDIRRLYQHTGYVMLTPKPAVDLKLAA